MGHLRIFAVRDVKAEAYLRPFFAETRGLGVRAFVDAVNDSAHPMHKHVEDYFFFELGTFDEESGIVASEVVPLGSAVIYLKGSE